MTTPLHHSDDVSLKESHFWLCLAWSGPEWESGRGGTGRPTLRRHVDRQDVIIGRGQEANWSFPGDAQLSRLHARVFLADGRPWVEDLHSTNGTFVNGVAASGPKVLKPGDVIRCGSEVFAICALSGLPAGDVRAARRFGLVGRFFSPELLGRAAEAAASGSHILVSGESGSGKELLVRAIAEIACLLEGNDLSPQERGVFPERVRDGNAGRAVRIPCDPMHLVQALQERQECIAPRTGNDLPRTPGSSSQEACGPELGRRARRPKLVTQNCAAFANEEEARATLFGVLSGVFSGVGARKGLIEEAEGGILHLDEVHELSIGVQRSLLRFAEDGIHRRVGDVGPGRKVRVRLVCTVNIPVEEAVEKGILAFDLVNRLQRVHVPCLEERRPDIPEIFDYHLERAARSMGLHPEMLRRDIKTWHMEALACGRYRQDNVRKLIRIANGVCAKVLLGWAPRHALDSVIGSVEGENPVVRRKLKERRDRESSERAGAGQGRGSVYERHKPVILATYRACQGNVSRTVRKLSERGIKVSRRWLAIYLKKWGERQ